MSGSSIAANLPTTTANVLLMRAAKHNDIPLARLAINLGANVNVDNRMNARPIHIASANGFVHLVSFLAYCKGIDLGRQDIFGYTPLALAIITRHLKIVKILLQAGADPNQISILHSSPVHLAVIQSDYYILKELITYKANVNRTDCFGKSPLHVSIFQTQNLQIIQTLLNSKANPNFKSKTGLPLLHEVVLAATDARMLAVVQLLVNHGVDVNEKDDVKQENALHKAAMAGYEPVISFLVAQGGDLEAVNLHNLRPYDIAILHLNRKAAEALDKLEFERDQDNLRELSSILNKNRKKRIHF